MITIEQARTLRTRDILIALKQRKSLKPEVVEVYTRVLHERKPKGENRKGAPMDKKEMIVPLGLTITVSFSRVEMYFDSPEQAQGFARLLQYAEENGQSLTIDFPKQVKQ
jgi:hypothetical protein